MAHTEKKLLQLRDLIDRHTHDEGLNATPIANLIAVRASEEQCRTPAVYEPMLILAAQGRKNVYLEGERFEYGAGQFLALFTPMAFECELVGVTVEQPLLAIGIRLDRHRLANLLLKMESTTQGDNRAEADNSSGVFSAPVSDKLLDAAVRLMQTLDDATEARVLGESIIDEIYYRILSDEQGGALKLLLRQHGQIQQISKAVELLHDNLDKAVPVEELASTVNMSVSGFHKKFKEVMHLSPLQYIKLIRLNRARTYILEGHSVSDAGYRVGYNSPAQFSREYKRQFGVAPSST
ncbi:DNA-binding response regulator, AraC family [Marinobacterium lacunae]|uniref:DNA-binding response regulator, AraC family n=1 Tax=Marinobacterium lacunae TaxID=1232683 RepID=A0A081FV91_9GAMM|nr:AraC family transcriptional regulator [Marinobacterium lacunae]KEA62446.1 DNA-binding response regulator, AraC family [Marinobacterium lacunae]MBR9882242.1 AraC family transcriptional regulator [Oceanospirillales bacterium]